MQSLFVLLAVALLGVESADIALPCTDGAPANFDSVKVLIGDVECTTSPCLLVRGQTATAHITFTAKNEISQLVQKANATVLDLGGITTPFPIKDADLGCERLEDGSYCPLSEGEVATNVMSVPVSKLYPKVTLLIELILEDQNGDQVACFGMRGDVV